MSRIANVVRLQFVNRQTFVGIPLMILGSAFVLSLAILALVPYTDVKYAGGAAGAPMWYIGVVGAQALTLTFPFALSLGVTRREFHLGTLLTAAATAMGLAAIYCIIAIVEGATNGWGMNSYFSWPFLGADKLGTSFLAYFTATMLLFSIGYLGAAVAKRWGAAILVFSIIVLVAVLALAITLATRNGTLPDILAWFAGLGIAGGAGLALLLVALLWLASYLLVRRLTP